MVPFTIDLNVLHTSMPLHIFCPLSSLIPFVSLHLQDGIAIHQMHMESFTSSKNEDIDHYI
jgi:hypothetical protein